MSTPSSFPDPLFAGYLEAAATAVRIGVGYVPPELASLLSAAKDSRLGGESHARALKRADGVWVLVEEAWDRTLTPGSAGLFYEMWSDRFAGAAEVLDR